MTLIDLDVTGTSLVDGLDVEAPRLRKQEGDTLVVGGPSDGFLSADETAMGLQERAIKRAGPCKPTGVPFLNDYFALPGRIAEAKDVHLAALCYRLHPSLADLPLRLIPSSALPDDVSSIVPQIYQDVEVGFLESRLEALLDALLMSGNEQIVIFDTPPTLVGFGRSALNLAMRLGRGRKTPLARDGYMPARLKQATVEFRPYLVTGLDVQDLKATHRWLASSTDMPRPRLVINKTPNENLGLMHLRLKSIFNPGPKQSVSAADEWSPLPELPSELGGYLSVSKQEMLRVFHTMHEDRNRLFGQGTVELVARELKLL